MAAQLGLELVLVALGLPPLVALGLTALALYGSTVGTCFHILKYKDCVDYYILL